MGELINVLLVDDHALIRISMKQIIESTFHSVKVEEAKNGKMCLDFIKLKSYDLLILDLYMPDHNPLAMIEMIREQRPNLPILIVSMCPEALFGKRLFDLGVMGYVSKKENADIVSMAIQSVLVGKLYMSERMKDIIIDLSINRVDKTGLDELTNRELEIVMLLVKGNRPVEIAQILSLSPSTIGTYKVRIYRKLGVSNIVELCKVASLYDFEIKGGAIFKQG